MSNNIIIDILVIAISILLNGLVTGAELAVLSCNKMKIRQKAEAGDKKAALIKKVLDEPEELMPSVALTYTVIGVFVGTYSGLVFSSGISNWLLNFEYFRNLDYHTLGNFVAVILTVIISYFSIIFAETIPKSFAVNNSEQIAYIVVEPLMFIAKVLKPIAKFLTISSNLVMRIFRMKGKKAEDLSTEEDIKMMIEDSEKEGLIEEDEKEMINNIFAFNDKTAEEIATHRTDIVSLNVEDDYDEIIRVIYEDYSRIPVYEEDIDNIIGVVHVKDLMRRIIEKPKEDLDIRSFLRPPYFFPSSKKLNDLFSHMQDEKIPFSIIIDEYGGTFGIVTMEDMIEEVMGEIYDEYDEVESEEINKNFDGSYIIKGATSIEDVNSELEININNDEHDTISGFVVGQLGHIPTDEEKVEIEIEGYIFKICSVSEKRIQELLVKKADEVPLEDEEIEE